MSEPQNQAAQLIVSAQSVIADLTVQAGEIQAAIGRQQSLIDSLTPVAQWAQDDLDPVEESPVEPPVEGGQ